MITIYKNNETDFTSNGLAVLNNCKSCFVTQELNGTYSLELEHPIDERSKHEFLEGFNIIKADGQLFRIDTPESIQDNGMSKKIYAPHIFYDNNYAFVENVELIDSTIDNALVAVLQGSKFSAIESAIINPTKTNTVTFAKINPTQAIFNILDLWGGELYRDNFNITIKSSIGSNKGVLISYAKNITGFNQKLDYTGIATRILVTGKDGATIESVNGGSKYLDSPIINSYPFPIIREKSFSDITDLQELKLAGLALWGTIDVPSANYTINFPDLSKTEEYKNFVALQSVNIGDTVIVRHKIFKVDMQLRVIKIKKDVLLNKFVEIELGDFKPNLGKTLNKQVKDIEEAKKDIEQVKEDIILANGELGGYILTRFNADKKPYEFLIMDTEDVETAIAIWKWDKDGLKHSRNGINGIFDMVLDINGNKMTGLEISTAVGESPNAHIEIHKEYMEFKNLVNGVEQTVFYLGVNMPGAETGKPQLFFTNGCSIDTFDGKMRARKDSKNYSLMDTQDFAVFMTDPEDETLSKGIFHVTKDGVFFDGKKLGADAVGNSTITFTSTGFTITDDDSTKTWVANRDSNYRITSITSGEQTVNVAYNYNGS